MDFKKSFVNSAAAVAVVISGAASNLAFVEPAEAQSRARTQVEPRACIDFNREQERVARQEQRANERAARTTGRAIQNGIGRNGKVDLGDILGNIGGGLVEREMARPTNDRLNYLYNQCQYERAQLAQGICVETQRESGSVATENGRIVGNARGRRDDTRECTSTSTGNAPSILSPNPRTHGGTGYEHQYRR